MISSEAKVLGWYENGGKPLTLVYDPKRREAEGRYSLVDAEGKVTRHLVDQVLDPEQLTAVHGRFCEGLPPSVGAPDGGE